MPLGTNATALHHATDVAKRPRLWRIVLVFPILLTLRLRPSFTHVLCRIWGVVFKTKTVTSTSTITKIPILEGDIRSPTEGNQSGTNIPVFLGNIAFSPNSALGKEPSNIQVKVHSNKGLEEARVSFSPVSDTVTHAFYDHVVVSHSTPRRLLQNVNDLTDFAWTRELPFAKHEFHNKRVLESFEAVDRETSSGSRTTEHAL